MVADRAGITTVIVVSERASTQSKLPITLLRHANQQATACIGAGTASFTVIVKDSQFRTGVASLTLGGKSCDDANAKNAQL